MLYVFVHYTTEWLMSCKPALIFAENDVGIFYNIDPEAHKKSLLWIFYKL